MLKGYATILGQMSLEELEKHFRAKTCPQREAFELSAERAWQILRQVYRRRKYNLVQLNAEVPKAFRDKLRKEVARRGGDMHKAVKEGMGKWMREAKVLP